MTKEEAKKILETHQKCQKAIGDHTCEYNLIGRCEPCAHFTSDEEFKEAEDMAIEALSAEPQGFEDYLKQYLGENDLKIIGNDVWEETKAKAEQTEWISVKDRLPSESDIYWVTVTDTRFERNLVHAFAYDINSKRWANGHLLNSERVIAWMKREVPSPYKGEQECGLKK